MGVIVTILKTQEYIAYLDGEIEGLRRELEWPGWSRWAIVGAMATLVWLLFDLVETTSYSVSKIIVSILTVSLFTDGMTFLSQVVNRDRENSPEEIRFHVTKQIFGNNRGALLLLTARWIVPIVLAIGISDRVHLALTISSIMISVLFLLVAVPFMVLSFMRVHFPTSIGANRPSVRFISAVLGLVAVLSSLGYGEYLLHSLDGLDFPELRIVVTTLSLFVLLFLLTRSPHGLSILKSLTLVRRNLALNAISVEDAARETEIALAGLAASEAFQAEVSEILDLIGEGNSKMHSVNKQLVVLESLWAGSGGHLTDDQQTISDSLYRSTMLDVLSSNRFVKNKLEGKISSLNGRLAFAASLAGNTDDSLYSVMEKIRQALDENQAKAKENIESIVSLIRTTEGDEAVQKYEDEFGKLLSEDRTAEDDQIPSSAAE
jgi:hypothetical protein